MIPGSRKNALCRCGVAFSRRKPASTVLENALDAFCFVLGDEPATDFRDLDAVETTRSATSDDGDVIPAGSQGTVVSVIRDGFADAVEFAEPEGAVATLLAADLRRANVTVA